MVPLRSLVVEDEWPARNYLVELLQASRMAEVVGAVATLDEASQALRPEPDTLGIDVVFADVHLVGSGDSTGLDLVRAQASRTNAPMFVLATAFREHAFEAFELGVVDYLLKPFTEERVEQCLRRLRARRPPRVFNAVGPSKIVARRKRGLVFLRADEVWAFEAADRLTFVHTPRGRFDLDLSLSAIETSFGRALLRVHRNWLVNPEHVQELVRDSGETELFVGAGIDGAGEGVKVPVARERAQTIRDRLLQNATGVRRS
ncbi:MAG: LytTR family DNA-binding domain-containing protein [Polyangiales bacterium]